jgi:hypothetical protein
MSESFSDLNAQISAKRAELDALMAQFNEKMKGEFTKLTKAFFEETGIQAIVWTQYTPYFNDGEECTFSVHEPVFVRKNFDPGNLASCSYEYEDDQYDPVDWSSYRTTDDRHAEVCRNFWNFMESNEGLLEDIFGNHVIVYLTADDAIAEEYDHD